MTSGIGIDIRNLVQLSGENFKNVLNKIPGDKDLILEGSLMKPLDSFAGMATLKSLGVQKIYKFEDKPPPSVGAARVYVVFSSLFNAKYILNHYNERNDKTSFSDFNIIFVPRVMHSVKELFEEEGLYGKIKLFSYMWELIPLGEDLLSLECPRFFPKLFARGDSSFLSCVSHSILNFEDLFGGFSSKVAVGNNAVMVLNQIQAITSKRKEDQMCYSSKVDYLFLLDRDVDYVSCLLSPLTYESLLDEVFGINCGTIELDKRVTSSDKVVKLQLSDRDKTFVKIRHKHFGDVFSYLSINARQLKQHQSRASKLSVHEMKQFVQNNLKDIQSQHKSISIHVGISEVIQKEKGSYYEYVLPIEYEIVRGRCLKEAINVIEEFMAQLYPIDIVLRLISLVCLCHNGLPSNVFQTFRHNFIQSYGLEKIHVFGTLQKMGLFFKKDMSNKKVSFQSFATRCKLLPADAKKMPLNEPSHPSYVFNGTYTPLIAYIVESILKSGEVEDVLKNLSHLNCKASFNTMSKRSKHALIYFIGGYTSVEIAALKMLQTTTGYSFTIAGTSNVTGKTIVESSL